jgi:FAD/FMN-containing dehydrogenase
MQTRRQFLRNLSLLALAPPTLSGREREIWLNDIHSQLNRTRITTLVRPRSGPELLDAIRSNASKGAAVCVSGSRHSMGGQQFLTGGVCIDTRSFSRVLGLDRERGLIEAEAGIQWPQLIRNYLEQQQDSNRQWGIAQKQTGADTFTLGGSLSSNVHGRGLKMRPLISDVESFTIIGAAGKKIRCSRTDNPKLFQLAIGGYGLFGAIDTVRLQLVPRRKLRRVVEIINRDDLMKRFEERIAQGYLYGDFQYAIDEKSPDFLRQGVFSCYQPINDDSPVQAEKKLGNDAWLALLQLAYTDRTQAFERYASYYLSTTNQTYWSDTNQLSAYLPNYAQKLREKIGGDESSLLITEIYVPRTRLADFLGQAAELLRAERVLVIYGTVRLIEKDNESFLAWAKQDYACVIFNLLTIHTETGMSASQRAFRGLIDLAIERQGNYYLTYHRFATRDQVLACYPQFEEFLKLKRHYDPDERFQSDWYRHYRTMFGG